MPIETQALDLNSDGMSDVWQDVYGVGPTEGLDDPDGDGENNLRESFWGTDPGDPASNSRLSVSMLSTNVGVSWLGVDQKLYQLQSSGELLGWSNFLGVITGTGGTSSVMMASDVMARYLRNQILPDADRDGDGLLDWEEGLLGADPDAMDADQDGVPDIYEYLKATDAGDAGSVPTSTWFVSSTALPGGDGSTNSPFDTIQAALDAAADYDIIELADGTYTGTGNRNLNFGGKDVLLRSVGGAQNCVIDCEGSTRAFNFTSGETRFAILGKVTIRRAQSSLGAGINISGSSTAPIVWGCVIEDCSASSSGAAVQISSANPIFDTCIFRNNTAGNDGGACVIASSAGTLFRNCQFLGNFASDDGGAVYHSNSSADPTYISCLIAGNVCGDGGGGFYNNGASPSLINCTVVNNLSGPTTGGGLFNSSASAQPLILNSVLWGNTPNQIQGGTPTVMYSVVQGGFAGVGNMDGDPMLTAAHRLTSGSPAIDAGTSDNAPLVDFDREDRFDDSSSSNLVSIVDIGADEFVDIDADGLADLWEIEFFGDLSHDGTADGDVDDLTDLQEYELATNPGDADTDDDGLDDGDEVNVYGTPPMDPDADDDFMTDGQEIANGLDPLDASDQMEDADGDGIPNLYEVVHASSPTNAVSTPAPSLHVDASASPGGDGSPGSPFDTIQDALNAAVEYDIVQVADGVYTGTANKNLDFNGKAVMLYSTNGAVNCVIDCELSGRGVAFLDKEDQRTLLQGLTIRNGSQSSGGGLSILTDASPLIRDCRIENCVATISSTGGGGVYCANSKPTFERCTISNNDATTGSGGGIYLASGSSSVFRHCRIVGNYADDFGGGIRIATSSVTSEFQSCFIADNEAGLDGGGMYNNGASPLFINCTVAGNRVSASTAGGMFNNGGSPVLQNCIVWANLPDGIVGGAPIISYSAVQGGTAGTGNLSEDPALTPLTFRLTSSSPAIDAGSDTNAPPFDVDGEARVDDSSHSNIVSIVDIGADEFVDTDNDDLADVWELEHFGDLSANATNDTDMDGLNELGEYEKSGDPNDTDTDNDGLTDGDEALVHGTSLVKEDTDGDETPDGWEVAHGLDPLDPSDRSLDNDADRFPNIYEFVHGSDPTNAASVPAATLYVDAAASPGGDGSFGNPFDTIQAGLTAALDYDIVYVADGVYTGTGNLDLDFSGKAVLLLSESGATNCIIDCQQNGRGFSFENAEDDRSVVDGFTVQNGYESVGGGINFDACAPTLRRCVLKANHSWSSSGTTGGGGGIRCLNGASPLIQQCTIVSNTAVGSGGGLFLVGTSSPRIEDCVIAGNSCTNTTFGGGGILISTGNAILRDCVLSNNYAQGKGGGIYRLSTGSVIERCHLLNNRAAGIGGGIYSQSCSGAIRECNITANRADAAGSFNGGGGIYMLTSSDAIENSAITENTAYNGGGLHLQNSDPQLLHIVVSRNAAADLGGGIYTDAGSGPTLHNTIVWSNVPNALNLSPGSPQISYSCIEGSWAGPGNLDVDPLLTRHYRLRSASPCIDAGSASNSVPFDIDGESRWDDPTHTNTVSNVDIGWDEFVDTDADAVADAWEMREFGDLSHTGGEDADSDGGPDGLTVVEEYENDTDPNKADTDGDTLVDGYEVDVYGTDPLDVNTDEDNATDDVEVAIGSDPLNTYDIVIENISTGPFFYDPDAGLCHIDLSLNWASTVRVTVYPTLYSINYVANIIITPGTVPVRTLEVAVPAGTNSVYWDGRDDMANLLPAGPFLFTVEAASADGLLSVLHDPRASYNNGVSPAVTGGAIVNEGEFAFWRNKKAHVQYNLSSPAIVAIAPVGEAYPVVWGEARNAGLNIEHWDGRGGTAVRGQGDLFQVSPFQLEARTRALPETTVVVQYVPDVITNLIVETYLVVPRYAEVTRISYILNEVATTDVRIEDPDGNQITVLDPALQPAGPHEVEWRGQYDTNSIPYAEGDYRIVVTATGSTSLRTHEVSANVTVRNR